MRVVLDTNEVSPHTLPLANAIRGLGLNLAYLYFRLPKDPYRAQELVAKVEGFGRMIPINDEFDTDLCEADFLIENNRKLALMAKRIAPTVYTSERWFKPIRIDTTVEAEIAPRPGLSISGFCKIIVPFIWRRVWTMINILERRRGFYYLPIGIVAARDMARMCGLMHGDLRCLFRAPELQFEQRPGGRIRAVDGQERKYCLDRMRMWGYFVESSPHKEVKTRLSNGVLRVLWVGRILHWKRLDTLVRAVRGLENVKLDIFGGGFEEHQIKKIARGAPNVAFKGFLPLREIRRIMQEHDVYVLPSNAFEGWGAVVNEALEEGMKVVGTYEAGASATILPESNLFHAGDWRRLRELLTHPIPDVGIGAWSVKSAAKALMSMYEELKKEVDGQ